MAIPTLYDEHTPPRLTPGVRVLAGIAAALLFLQWTVVSGADATAALGFHEGELPRVAWRAATYLFVHVGLWHLAITMYALLTFGPRLEEAMGTRAFVLYYLWCGLGGAITWVLFSRTGVLVGGAAASLGIMYAYLQQWPSEELTLFGVIPMRASRLFVIATAVTLATCATALDLVGVTDALSYLTQLGGLAFGWLYFRTPPAASLDRLRQRISPAPDTNDDVPPRAIPRTLPRARAQRDDADDIVAKSKAVSSQTPPRPIARATVSTVRTGGETRAAELDRVLDKISSTGLASLSHDERAVLDAMARRLRGEG
ncbi:MAG: rhomboid family intramembrane serine protease [Gemmatimonadaceae bacterium]|nr:rhomboid family intramembrane serine protease [Gemmatimonadaceae bacterium]